MITQSRDTSPEAEQVLIELLRQAPVWRKWQITQNLRHTAKNLAMVGLRTRFPQASEVELQRRLAAHFLGEELATLAYGPIESDG